MKMQILILLMFVCQLSAALRFHVTKKVCGQSIDLAKENHVTIDYDSSDFINMTGFCVIDITTKSSDEMICITSNNRTYLIDIKCTWSLSYHIGEYSSYGKHYSCNDFNRRHLCKNTRRVALAYSDNPLFKNVFISVSLFTKTYKPTTTRRPWSSWSSWTSWSSSDDYDNDRKAKKGRSGAIIGVIIGTIAGIVLFTLCVVVKCSKTSRSDDQNYTYPQVQYSPENQHTHEDSRLTANYAEARVNQPRSSGSQPVQPSSQGPPSYEEYEKHQSLYKPVKNDEESEPPDMGNYAIPSAPPPPYPGNKV